MILKFKNDVWGLPSQVQLVRGFLMRGKFLNRFQIVIYFKSVVKLYILDRMILIKF